MSYAHFQMVMLSLESIYFFTLNILCVWTMYTMHMVRDQRLACTSQFSFLSVCVPGINIDAIRLGVMHLDLLNHITGPINVFLAYYICFISLVTHQDSSYITCLKKYTAL